MSRDTLRAFSWDIKTLTKAELPFISIPCMRCLARLKVDNLTVDLDAILNVASLSSAWRWDLGRERSMQKSMHKTIQRNLRIVLRLYKIPQHQGDGAQPALTDDVTEANNAGKEDDRGETNDQKGKHDERSVNGELNKECRYKSKTLGDNDQTQRHEMDAAEQEGAGEREIAAEHTDYPEQKRAAEREGTAEKRHAADQKDSVEQRDAADDRYATEQKDSVEPKDTAEERDIAEQKDSFEQNDAAEEDDGTDTSSTERNEDIEPNYSVTIKFCPTGELAFVASMITVSGPCVQTANTRNLSLIVSIIRTDTGQRKVTGQLGLATIGAPTKECVVIEYDPVHKVLAYAVSLMYHQKTEDGSFWRMCNLFVCRLSQPTVIADSKHGSHVLYSKKFDLGKANASSRA